MLIPDSALHDMSDYAEFVKILSWFRMFCVCQQGSHRRDYEDGFMKLEQAYAEIKAGPLYDLSNYYLPDEYLDLNVWRRARKMMADLRTEIIESPGFSASSVDRIGGILTDFYDRDESDFRRMYQRIIRLETYWEYYSDELRAAVGNLLHVPNENPAVIEAFKYLDRLLQSMTGTDPHDSYGEDLVNRAFSREKGKLQLGTSDSEQNSLRNLFSGANGVFRNQAAHRSLASLLSNKNPHTGAAGIVTLVGLLETIALNVYHRNVSPKIKSILAKHIDPHPKDPKWTEQIGEYNLSWSIHICHVDSWERHEMMRVAIVDLSRSPSVTVISRAQLDQVVATHLATDLRSATGFEVTFKVSDELD